MTFLNVSLEILPTYLFDVQLCEHLTEVQQAQATGQATAPAIGVDISHGQNTSFTMTSDDQWPPEIEQSYERIRILGQGAFGAVWLAKNKQSNALNQTEKTAQVDDDASIESFEDADQFDAPPTTLTRSTDEFY